MDDITFAVLLTAAGAGIAAGLVTSFVSLLKTVFAKFTTWDPNGMILAFIFSAILYVLAAISTKVDSLDKGLVVFIAWLTCATAAIGIHKVIVNPIVDKINEGNEG